MRNNANRRDFLRAMRGVGVALGGAALAGVRPDVLLAQSSPGELSATALRGELIHIAGAGGSVLALNGPEGVALIDSGSPGSSAELMELLAERFGGAAVRLLLNTHWHLGHTGGNEAIGEMDARIVAHENTRLWMSNEFYVDWQDRTYGPRPAAALPNDTFYSHEAQPLEVRFGGERIVYGHLREAHTDGDIYVFFPERNVIAAGGAFTVGAYPIMDYVTGGWIGGLVDATRKLIDMADADTLIVPKTGPAGSREDLEAQERMLTTVRERVEAMAIEGKGADEMLAAGITDEFDSRWGNNAQLFVSNVYEGLWWGGRMRGIIA